MNLGSNSKFSKAPVNNISRSIFDRSNTLVSSFSAGKLIPIYVDEVLPGDTCSMDMSFLCRMATPLYPVMDNAWIDIHFFFVPNRLIWDNWKYFCGESKDAWDSDIEYEIPTDYYTPEANNFSGYIGLPRSFSSGNPGWCEANALPRRAYWLIWNEWFRDQNLQDPLLIDKGDAGNPSGAGATVDSILPVNKYHDYFTSCLPEPQKGVEALVTLGGLAPVKTGDLVTSAYSDLPGFNNNIGISFWSANTTGSYFTVMLDNQSRLGAVQGYPDVDNLGEQGYTDLNDVKSKLYPANLWADLSSASSGVAINELRQAFAVQRLLERDARGGTRYRELVKAHFGVDVPDSRVQVPEYLGGAHVPINIMQVVQQSSTTGEPSPLGETGAVSKTVHSGSMFTKSFVEHGYIMGFASVRTQHSYMQGIPRMFNRRTRFDFYWPELANIGEQAVMTKEIYGIADDTAVFGYQEAWADYRYKPNQITGNMSISEASEGVGSTLGPWHFGDFYEDRPYLSDEWIRETDENIARTLAVSNTKVFDQFLFDAFFKARWARPMPVYSIPGLTGHF